MTEPQTDDLSEFEEQLGRKQRIKRIVSIAVVVAVVAVVAIVYLAWPKQPDPRCKDSDVRVFLKSREIPAVALHRVCSLPAPLAETLKGCLAFPPPQRKLLIFKMVTDHPKLITRVCRHMRKAVSEAMVQSPDQQAATFLRRCDLSSTGIGSPSDLAQAPLHRILLAMAVYGVLKSSDRKWAAKLARRMLH
jgi:hypothetical protein